MAASVRRHRCLKIAGNKFSYRADVAAGSVAKMPVWGYFLRVFLKAKAWITENRREGHYL